MRAGLVAVLLLGSTTAASAGGYLGLGIGTGPATSGDMSFDEDGRSGRLQVGYRFGRFSVEGLGQRYDLERNDGDIFTGTTLGLAGKFNMPLGDKFEAFGRAGLQHTSVSNNRNDSTWGGGGWLIGAGFEYRIDVAAVAGALFVDYTIQHAGLTNEMRGNEEVGLTERIWTLGATVSL